MKSTDSKGKGDGPITARGYIFVALWGLFLLSLAAATGYAVSSYFYDCRLESIAIHDSYLIAPAPAADTISGQKPVDVQVGVCMDRVSDLSIRDNKWIADFFIWFSWKGEDIDPGENLQVVYGEILSKQKQVERVDEDLHYQLYEVEAEITKFFNVSRFPCDDHQLMLSIEDSTNDSRDLRYVPDTRNTSIGRNLKIPGFQIYRTDKVVRENHYMTSFGDPHESINGVNFSRLYYIVSIVRPGGGLYIKIFQGLFIAVAVSLLSFLIRSDQSSPRFSVSLGALFAAVANGYLVSSMQPGTEVMTVADVVTGLGIATIFLTLFQSTISLYIFDHRGEKALSRLFDKVSLVVIFAGYTAINLAIPMAASILIPL